MIENLHGTTAVLTGAGSGFGLECARLAAQHGMNLVLVDVQQDALHAAAAELAPSGCQILTQCVDVANAGQMEQLAETVQQRFGAPHWVFNNAGIGAGGLIWENSVRDWEWVLGVNLWGVIHGVRLFTPMMLQAARTDPTWRGHIVNTASMAGLLTPPNMGIYNVSKHAVVGLTETLYQDLRLVTEQISASVLCPYFVPTGIVKHSEAQQMGASLTPSQRINQTMLEQAVSRSKVTAADVARKVFAAVQSDQFYIFSHPHALGNVQSRMESIIRMENPADPFLERPEVGQRLKEALRSV